MIGIVIALVGLGITIALAGISSSLSNVADTMSNAYKIKQEHDREVRYLLIRIAQVFEDKKCPTP
jgi:hypothetical protein